VFNARTARVNARVSFDGTRSYDVAGRITRYVWNYGDGSPFDTTHGARGVHVYGRPGVYLVSLTVQDASGPQNATTQTQTVVAR
jgi:PKD repeat protein